MSDIRPDFDPKFTQCAECGGTFQHYTPCRYFRAAPPTALVEPREPEPDHCENCRAEGVPLTTVHLCTPCLPAAPSEHRAPASPAVVERAPLEQIIEKVNALQVYWTSLDGWVPMPIEMRKRYSEFSGWVSRADVLALLLAWPSSRERETKP